MNGTSMIELEAFELFMDRALNRRMRRRLRPKSALPHITKQLLPTCSGLIVSIPEFMRELAAGWRPGTCPMDNDTIIITDDEQVVSEMVDYAEQQFIGQQRQFVGDGFVQKHEFLAEGHSRVPSLLLCDPTVTVKCCSNGLSNALTCSPFKCDPLISDELSSSYRFCCE
ncbi:unnamed protein product [Toxocara canis]|uniref:Uncharacterized protein n=1 Tax=Toxocara canis TaxID=6265 RepID=A0A183VHB1_TOXCA|nr:unnamed protein product [Toxocara canis]